MKIRYLVDGVAMPSQDMEVMAEGSTGYYIQNGPKTLLFIPREFVFMKIYEDSEDSPSSVYSMIESSDFEDICEVDYSLEDLFTTVH